MSNHVPRRYWPSKGSFGGFAGMGFLFWLLWWVGPWVFLGFRAPADLTRDASAVFGAIGLPILSAILFIVYLVTPRTQSEEEERLRREEARSPETSVARLKDLADFSQYESVRLAATQQLRSPYRARELSEIQAEARRKESVDYQQRRAAEERLRAAKSTDTPRELLRALATGDPAPETRRAAIETLALLNSAGL